MNIFFHKTVVYKDDVPNASKVCATLMTKTVHCIMEFVFARLSPYGQL